MSRVEIAELLKGFQALVFDGIQRYLREDGHCKHYEGRVRFQIAYPSYFERDLPPEYSLMLDCYVFGPARHYRWEDTDVANLFRRATQDVRAWIAEAEL